MSHKLKASKMPFKRCPVCKIVFVRPYFAHECSGPPAEAEAPKRAKGWKKGRG